MTKVTKFISVKDKLTSLLIRKRNIARKQFFVKRYSDYFLQLFVPYENASFLDSLHRLPQIMLVLKFSFPLIEITLWLLLLNLGDIDPFLSVTAALCLPKNVVLEDLLVLPFGANGIKGSNFFNSVFLQNVTQLFIFIFKLCT